MGYQSIPEGLSVPACTKEEVRHRSSSAYSIGSEEQYLVPRRLITCRTVQYIPQHRCSILYVRRLHIHRIGNQDVV